MSAYWEVTVKRVDETTNQAVSKSERFDAFMLDRSDLDISTIVAVAARRCVAAIIKARVHEL